MNGLQHSMTMQFLHARSAFMNPTEEFFSAWTWKVYDHQPHDPVSLLEAMNADCLAVDAEDFQGRIQHAMRLFPAVHFEGVDESPWPNRQEQMDYMLSISTISICFLDFHP